MEARAVETTRMEMEARVVEIARMATAQVMDSRLLVAIQMVQETRL